MALGQSTQVFRPEEFRFIGPRRPLDEDVVSRLMESIKKFGLIHLPTIRIINEIDDPIDGRVVNARVVIAGKHRIEACKRLGWKVVECLVVDADDVAARMLEISENLDRAELTALERREQKAELIKLKEHELISAQVEPKLKSDTNPKGAGRNEGGVRAAARELGIEKEDARRSKAVASLSPEAKQAARETGLDDNDSTLLKAAREEDAEQEAVIRAEAAKRNEEERRKKADRASSDAKRVVEYEASKNFAEWLIDHHGAESVPTIITFLQTSKAGDVIAALRRMASVDTATEQNKAA